MRRLKSGAPSSAKQSESGPRQLQVNSEHTINFFDDIK